MPPMNRYKMRGKRRNLQKMNNRSLEDIRVLSAVWVAIAVPTTFLRWWMRLGRSFSCRSLVERSLIYEIFTFLPFCGQIIQLIIFQLPASGWGPGRSYIRLITFYIIVWSSRISLLGLFVASKMGEPLPWYKKQFLIMMLIYFLIMIGLIVQALIICHIRTGWREGEMPQCPLGKQVAISHFVADGVSDVLLFYKVFSLLWQLHGFDRWRVIGSCSLYLAIMAASIVHACFIFQGKRAQEVIAGVIECGICILAANLPFVVAYFNRCFRSSRRPPEIPNSPAVARHGTWMSQPRKRNSVALSEISTVMFTLPRDAPQGNDSIELTEIASPVSPGASSTPPQSPASTPSSTISLIKHARGQESSRDSTRW